MYVMDEINPTSSQHPAIQPAKLAEMTREFRRRGQLNGAFEQLMPYIQLKREFGWAPFKQVFAEYRAIPVNQKPKTTQDRKDEWLVRFSKAVGRNLGPFYDDWKIETSPAAKQQVSHLPEWKPRGFDQ
jgi:hypothetical protein